MNSIANEIEVRHCKSLAEYEDCVRLEIATWGESIAVPPAIFVVAHHTGGQILGAFDGLRLVGFTMAMAGFRPGQRFLHSHMTAVLPEYQNSGIARRLKLLQRDDALARGIPLVEWTFDPLELKNAHFNLVRLGAVARRYIPDCYGLTRSPLHAGLPTDRLVAEWWLASDRVQNVLAGRLPAMNPEDRISIPSNVGEVKVRDSAAGERIQAGARSKFERALRSGLVATSIEQRGTTADYILEPVNAIAGLTLPELATESAGSYARAEAPH